MEPQFEHATRLLPGKASWARRRSRLPLECLRFGWGVMTFSFLHTLDGPQPVHLDFYQLSQDPE